MSDLQFEPQEPNANRVNILLILTMVGVGVLFVWSVYFFKSFMSQALVKSDNVYHYKITEMKSQQDKELSTLKWLDKTKGTVQIPIDLAMKLTVKEYEK